MIGIFTSSRRKDLVGYAADAVTFDGANDRLEANFSSSATDGKTGIISFWYRPFSFGTVDLYVITGENSSATRRLLIRITTTGEPIIQLRNTSGTIVLEIQANLTYLSLNSWNHVLASWDLGITTPKMYLNNIDVTENITTINDNIEYSVSAMVVGDLKTNTRFLNGDFSELYFNMSEPIDLTLLANREKFISNNGIPINLGGDGSTPTGTSPGIYLKGDASVWNAGTNAGSLGNFTMSGAVTDSINEPIQLPSAVNFNGSAWVGRNTPLIGAPPSSTTFLYSVWLHSPFGGTDHIFNFNNTTDNNTFEWQFHASNANVNLTLRTSSQLNIMTGTSTSSMIANQWNHVLISRNGSTIKLYINDIQSGFNVTPSSAEQRYNTNKHYEFVNTIGSGGGVYIGDAAEHYFAPEYLDIDIIENRRKFITVDGKPADLGFDGSLPTGTAPLIYMTGASIVWQNGTNAGTGGNLISTGTITNSVNEPIALP